MGSIKGETDPFQYMVKYHTSLNSICQSPQASSKNFTIRKLRSWVRWGLLINWGSFELISHLFILKFLTTTGSRSRCSNRGIQIQNNNGDYSKGFFFETHSWLLLLTIHRGLTIYRQEQIWKRKFKLELGLQSFLVRMNSCMIPCKQEQSFFCVGAYAT